MAVAGGKPGQGRAPARFVYVTRFGSHRCGGVLQLGGRQAEGLRSPRVQAGGSLEEPRGAAAGTRGGGDLLPGPEPRGPAASSAARASSARSGGKSAARAGLIRKTLVKKYDFPIPFNEASKIVKKKKKNQSLVGEKKRAIANIYLQLLHARHGHFNIEDGRRMQHFQNIVLSYFKKDFLLDDAPRSGGPVEVDSDQIEMFTESNQRSVWEMANIFKISKSVSVWKKVHRLICRMIEENEKYRLRLKGQRLSSENSDYTR